MMLKDLICTIVVSESALEKIECRLIFTMGADYVIGGPKTNLSAIR